MTRYEDAEKAVFSSLESARKAYLEHTQFALAYHAIKALVLAVLAIAVVLDDRP